MSTLGISHNGLSAPVASRHLEMSQAVGPEPHALAERRLGYCPWTCTRVLDLACGPGDAAGQMDNCLVFAADISEPMLRTARGRSVQRVVAANAQALPFGSAVLDAVTCQLGSQFFPNPPGALQEVLRVLRPGGRCAFSTVALPLSRSRSQACYYRAAGFW